MNSLLTCLTILMSLTQVALAGPKMVNLGKTGVQIFSLTNDDPENPEDVFLNVTQAQGPARLFKLPESVKNYQVVKISPEGLLTLQLTQVVFDKELADLREFESKALVYLPDLKAGRLNIEMN